MQKSNTLRTSTTSALSSPTFTMYGEPLPPSITGVRGLIEKVRKTSATSVTSDWDTYFASDNYDDRAVSTPNIIQGSVATTLRYNNKTYFLFFVCLHEPFWDLAKSRLVQISIVFRANNGDFYHICIPIAVAADLNNESPILRSWFQGSPVTPAGLTWNDILNFRGHEQAVNYFNMDFCLEYNYQGGVSPNDSLKKKNSYILSMFETPLYSRYAFAFSGGQPEKQTFDSIFNLFMRGTIHKYLATDKPDPYVTPDEAHFSDIGTQNTIIPVFVTVPTIQLSGTTYTQDQLTNNVRGLSNVKCYPIDLASEVDDNGNIYIDRESKKPVNTKAVLGDLSSAQPGSAQLNIPSGSVSVVITNERRNAIIYTCLALFIVSILILIAVWFFTRALPASSVVPDAADASRLAANAGVGAGAGAGAGAPRAAPGAGAAPGTGAGP